MEYLVGGVLALVVCGIAAFLGFDRDRSFFPTLLIINGTYYVLFATMAPSGRPLVPEIVVGSLFVVLGLIGFTRNLWFVVVGTAGHAVFDLVHHHLIENTGVPTFWPGFCLSFDVILGAWVAVRILKGPAIAARASAAKSVG